MKRKAAELLERSVKRIASCPGSGAPLLGDVLLAWIEKARSATKIQALWRGYRERPEVYCCAGARAEALCNMAGMTPGICCTCYAEECWDPEYYDPTCPAVA